MTRGGSGWSRARLYLVTDARQEQGDLDGFLEMVLAAGVDIVQLREKEAEAGDLLRWSTSLPRGCRPTRRAVHSQRPSGRRRGCWG